MGAIVGCLSLVLLIIGGVYWKKKTHAERYKYIDIPDFNGKPRVTLQEILDDPSIPVVPLEELQVKERLGQGASGVVYHGIWKHTK